MTKSSKNKYFDKKSKFLFTFEDTIKKEKSHLGRLVLQENLISIKIGALLYLIDFFMMYAFIYTMYSAKACLKNKKYINKKIAPLTTEVPIHRDVSGLTLGQIIKMLDNSNIHFFECSNFIRALKNYNTRRNKITHRILYEHDDIKVLTKETQKVVKLGRTILVDIDKLYKAVQSSKLAGEAYARVRASKV